MISVRDVVEMYIPFPGIDADLAVKKHMYICVEKANSKDFAKCQTFKPIKHLTKNGSRGYFLIETADPARNPFTRTTAIEYGKIFCVSDCLIERNNVRCICVSLLNALKKKIKAIGARRVELDSDNLAMLNSFIKKIV